MYSSHFAIIDCVSISDAIQYFIGGIEERVCINIMAWLNPFCFEYSPQGFGNVQMRRVWREEKDIKATLSPFLKQLLHSTSGMDACIVKNDTGWPCNGYGEVVDELGHILRLYTITACEPVVNIVPVNHSEDVEPCGFHGRHKDILSGKLPAVWYISLCTHMAFISEEKVNKPLITQTFKFLQLLALNCIELRRGCYPWAFGDTLISCARTSKKRLKVMSLAVFPEAFSQSSLALFTLCRSRETASRTNASSEKSIIGLRPWPGFVFRPAIPSEAYRFVQLNTDGTATSSFCATSALERFSPFRSIARQRIRNLWSEPYLYPASSFRRSSSVNMICFFFAMIVCIRVYHNINVLKRKKFYNK